MKAKRVKRLGIVGASTRAAAFSALRAGYEVVAADLFADADLTRACDATRVDGYPDALADWLASAQCDAWLYTGGLENRPELVEQMAGMRPLLGNGGDAMRRIRNPSALQCELAKAGLLFPRTVGSPAGLPRDGSWLCKTYRSASGAGVWTLDSDETAARCVQERAACQQFVEGVPASAVFVVSKPAGRLLGMTRQLVGEAWTGAGPWQYAGSVGPSRIAERLEEPLRVLANTLANNFALRGVVGVDLVLVAHQLWILEINPRYPASAEIVERVTGESTIAAHVAACVDEDQATLDRVCASPPSVAAAPTWSDDHVACGKAILFARRDVVVSEPFANWAMGQSSIIQRECRLADIPHAGDTVAAGHPVLTVFASAPVGQYDGAMRARIDEVERRLYGDG